MWNTGAIHRRRTFWNGFRDLSAARMPTVAVREGCDRAGNSYRPGRSRVALPEKNSTRSGRSPARPTRLPPELRGVPRCQCRGERPCAPTKSSGACTSPSGLGIAEIHCGWEGWLWADAGVEGEAVRPGDPLGNRLCQNAMDRGRAGVPATGKPTSPQSTMTRINPERFS